MKANTCAKNSAAIRQKEGRDKEIGNGNFVAALGYKVTVTICFEPSEPPTIIAKEAKKKN